MDRRSREKWFPALLTAGSFLCMSLTLVFACLDALAGSRWYGPEFALGLACGVSFASLLTTDDPRYHLADE